MKKITKIVAIIIAFLLIAGLLFVTNAFVGNPISKYLVDKNSDLYIEKQYDDLNLVKEIRYDFKSTRYYVSLKSETIDDLHFTLYYSLTGQLERDLYENNITNGWNVLTRLDEAYRNETDIIFEQLKSIALFKNSEHLYTSAHLYSKENIAEQFGNKNGGIDATSLELDKNYDIAAMGTNGGIIDFSVRFNDHDESFERCAMALKEIKTCFDEANMGFCFINIGIINEEGNFAYGIDLISSDQIDDVNLLEIIKENCNMNYNK